MIIIQSFILIVKEFFDAFFRVSFESLSKRKNLKLVVDCSGTESAWSLPEKILVLLNI